MPTPTTPLTTRPAVSLIGGGARSGKSSFALELARKRGERRAFIATARPSDDEMKRRIERHQLDRGPDFRLIESPLAVAEALSHLDEIDVVVVDCMTLWLSNLLLEKKNTDDVLAHVDRLTEVLARRERHTIVVTNEVGMSVHPPTALGRTFQELSGWAHQRLARVADEVYLAALGMVLRLRPSPIEEARGKGGD